MRAKTGRMKKILCSMLAAVLAVGLAAVPTEYAQAASKVKVPKALHMGVGKWDDDIISIQFNQLNDYITNLKTSSKNLKVKVTEIDRQNYGSRSNRADIGIYAIKKGTYTLSFDIYGGNDKKESSHSIKIYVNNDGALKKITFDGENMTNMNVTEKASGKLSVVLNKGYTLKKIEVQTYGQNGERKSETVKNNSNITLGKYAYVEKSGEDYSTVIMADTTVIVHYTDKYTKEEATISRVICRPVI